MEHRGFFLIADISGYTTYLGESELEHARQTLTDLLELVVDQTRPPLTVAQLEGDAVLSYALEAGFVETQTFIEMIEETYVEFRRAIDMMILNNACRCNACANVSTLDLKFFVHHGTFAIQPIGSITQLVGSDVNLVHRLLKNSVTADTGIEAYLLLTQAAMLALGLEVGAESMVAHKEAVADFGDMTVMIIDMRPVYEASRTERRSFYQPEDILMALDVDVPLPIEHVWNYANQSEIRNVITGSDSYEITERRDSRVGAGSTYRCYHGKTIVTQLVMEWLPFERVVLQQVAPLPGRRPTQSILDLQFAQVENGTRLSLTVTKPTGPLPQRLLARIMMTARRERTRADIVAFRDRIVDDYAADHTDIPGGRLTPSSSTIDTAISDSLNSRKGP